MTADEPLVPLAGIEPALLAELDFESSASTNSATGAIAAAAGGGDAKRAEYSGHAAGVNLQITCHTPQCERTLLDTVAHRGYRLMNPRRMP